MFELTDYADIKKLVNDESYATSKHLTVKGFLLQQSQVSGVRILSNRDQVRRC